MTPKHSTQQIDDLCKTGLEVIRTEAQAISSLANRIDENFAKACQYLLNCTGRIVVMGMGKSGHIANKIAATFASTGSPSFYVHPAEASHGDLGMITRHDVVLAVSYSGKTSEILTILPLIKHLEIPLISLTGDAQSVLAKNATVNIDVSIEKEACPLGLAPTASTTAALVMGDALAIALLQARGFTAEDFARAHPGGALGRRLLLRLSDIMLTGSAVPKVHQNAELSRALLEMTEKSLGMTSVVNDDGQLIGMFTDGDLRRTLDRNLDVHTTKISDVMTRKCKTVTPNMLVVEALRLMENHHINGFIVVDEKNCPIGAFNMHQLLQNGVI